MATSFADYLAGLPYTELTELLEIRPDARIDPAPVGFEQLAQRLCGPESLSRVLLTLDRDAVVVTMGLAALDRSATRQRPADLLGAGDLRGLAAEDRLAALAESGAAWLPELVLLAHATDLRTDVRIAYRNQAGNRSVREIRPERLYGNWLDSWCYLRNDQRDFTVANIEAVSPIG